MSKQLLFIFSLSVLILNSVCAQKLTTKSEKARDLYLKGADNLYQGNFEAAEGYLLKATKSDEKFVEPHLLLADIYNQQKRYDAEEASLSRALAIDSTFRNLSYYNLGMAQFYQGKFDASIVNLLKYRERAKDSLSIAKADKTLENARFSKNATAHPLNINPINLGDSVNSCYDEYWPSLRGDEEELVFTVLVPRDSILYTQKRLPRVPRFFHEDFYSSNKDSLERWLPRTKFTKTINTDGNEGAQSLSADGKWMFFTACGRADSRGSCDIYFSRAIPGGWSTPVNLNYPINTGMYDGQPCFSADGRTLYFISNRSGGVGEMDIWLSRIVGMTDDGIPIFGALQNLGSDINSVGSENSPFIHPDGKTIYFSSDGWTGMGMMDVFMSRKENNGKWKKPVNLGYPTNTTGDEIGFILNSKGDKAYFSSGNFSHSTRGKDIYSFIMPDTLRPTPASYLKGRVFDYNTKQQISAYFELIDVNTDSLTNQASTNYNGEFLLCLPIGINYALNVSKKGYLFYSQNVNLSVASSATAPIITDIYLKPIVANATIVLENIFFETASWQLLPESVAELNKLLTFLQNNPTIQIELSGHTDNVGSEAYNKNLSLQRATSVQTFLLESGIGQERIKVAGYGYSKPIDTNDTQEGRAHNRRTELKVLETNLNKK